MSAVAIEEIRMIPIESIAIVNPRMRNREVYQEIVSNIARLGLKRPITVTHRPAGAGGLLYDLVCGQGRLEACLALGQQEIAARVVEANQEDGLVASLVENCARRHHSAVELLSDITGMKARGNSVADIARKADLSEQYVDAVLRLLEKGEQRLLRAVESGKIPISVALDIAEADSKKMQKTLQDAYEKNLLRGKTLFAARRLVEQRQLYGRRLRADHKKPSGVLSTAKLVRAYQRETERRRMMIRRAEVARECLAVICEAMHRLLTDTDFKALLLAEGFSAMPEGLARRISRLESVAA